MQPPADKPAASLELAPNEAPAPLGNRADFDAIYREHFAFVWRSLRRLGVPSDALDDAVQDVFIIALRRAAEFQGRSSYRSWLYGIAVNVARDYQRKAKRVSGERSSTEEPQASGSNPFERASEAQAVRLVDRFLSSLDDGKRDVFVLAELEQMTIPEIARFLGIKLNTAYSRLRIARERFARLLDTESGK